MLKKKRKLLKLLSAFMVFSSVSPLYAEEAPVETPVTETETPDESQEVKEKIDLSAFRAKNAEKNTAPATETPAPTETPETTPEVTEEPKESVDETVQVVETTDQPEEEIHSEEAISSEEEVLEKEETPVNVDADLSSMRLIVAAEKNVIRQDDPVISEYNGIYLIQFETVQATAEAYEYYTSKADFVEPDVTFAAAEGEVLSEEPKSEEPTPAEEVPEGPEVEQLTEAMSEESNPLTELSKEEESGIDELGDTEDQKHMVIALIDSGVTEGAVNEVSMLGENTKDDNGHGTKMYDLIKSVNPDVDILSIKALDENGKGTASSILAAIEYARQAKVDVINLSLSAVGTAENSVVAEALKQAAEEGILIVGAAGNSHKNAKYYIPGGIAEAKIIGSATAEGAYTETSNFGDTVDYIVKADSTSDAAALYSAMITYSLMNNVNIATYPAFSEYFFLAPEVVGNLANEAPDSTEGSFYAAEQEATNVIDAKNQGMLLSKALKLYENGDRNNDYVYAYRGTVGGAYNSSNYIGRFYMYHPEDTPGYDGCVSNSTKTLRFWMPKVGTWKGRSIGAEVQYVDESSANSDPFSLDLKSPVDNPPLDDNHDSAQFGAFNVFARNSRQMHIYVTFYENVNTSVTSPNGDKLTLNTEAEHLFYGGIGLSNELKINGTTEWTAPKDDSQAVYSYITNGEKQNIDRTSWVKDTYNGKTIYYQANSDTTDGRVVDHLANFLYDGKGQQTLELYVGFRGPGVQVLDDNYTSGMYGDPSIWYRLRFAHIAEGNYGMYILDIDPNGGVYTDLTGEERAYQEPAHSALTDDWYIEDSSYGNTQTIDDKVYDGLDGISIPTREGYAFDGWTIIYGPGYLRNGQSEYVFGVGNGKIQAQWRHYKIFTEVVNGQITSDNAGTLGTGGQVTEILPDDDVTINYNPNRYYHLSSITVWERDPSKFNPGTSGDETEYEIAWKEPVTIDDWDTFRNSYNFEDVNNDYKIRVVYDPSLMKVNYLERETDVVMWQQAQQLTDGKGSTYRIESPEIAGYTLVEAGESQKVVEGIMPDDTYETNVYYTKDPMIGGRVTVRKTASAGGTEVVSPGDTITYTLTLTNSGAFTSGTTTVTDEIPEGTELVVSSLPAGATYEDGKITWEAGTAAAGANKSISYQVTVTGDSKSPIYSMATWTTSKEPGTPVHESNLVIIPRSNEIYGPAALESVKGESCSTKITTQKSGSQSFSYKNSVQTFTAPQTGTYTLQVWGAAGGNGGGGKGGYATGKLDLTAGTKLYVLTGGQGPASRGTSNSWNGYGFNGGGRGFSSDSSGGGATQITTTNRGTLNNFANFKGDVLVVAGGGGGGESDTPGGAGGGNSGGGTNPGTQTAGGADGAAEHKRQGKVATSGRASGFGIGADGASCSSNWKSEPCYGAGGGGWYGGGTGSYAHGGGGGSGYVNTSKLTATSMSNGVQSGNGKATISWVYDVVSYDTNCGNIGQSSSAASKKESTVTYSVTLRNNGNAVSHGSVLRDVIPSGATYVANSAKVDTSKSIGSVSEQNISFDSANNQVVAYFGDMPYGSSRTITFDVKVNGKNTTVENQADFGRDVGERTAAPTAYLKHKSNIVESYFPGSIAITKHWDFLPDGVTSVSIVLKRSDGATYNGTITAANGWVGTFSGMDLNAYTYQVYETNVPKNYKSSCPQSNPCAVIDSAGSITNTSKGTMRLVKVWQDEGDIEDRPTSVVYNLIGSDGSNLSFTITELEDWAKTVNVPLYSATGADLTYQVYETEIENYSSSAPQDSPISVAIGGTATITNELVRDFPLVKSVTDASDVDINTKTVGVGDNLYYHITMENPYSSARRFVVTDELPANTEFVSADNNGTLTGTTVRWDNLTINGKESATVTFVVKTTAQNKTIPNIGHVTNYKSDGISPDISKDTNRVVNYTPGITKDVKNTSNASIDTKSVEPGQTIHYEIKVDNPSNAAKNYTITDVLDTTNLDFVSADNNGVNTNGTVRWTDISVPAGGSKTVTVYAKVKENENTEIKNKARAIVELANVESNEVMNWKGMIKIYKAITNFYPEYGTPFFNFEIKDSAGNVWHRHVELSNSKQSDSAETFFVPTGIAETGGSFSIRELRNARYELSAAVGRTNMVVANNIGATVISKANPLGEIRFVNEINKWNKITHAASAVNTFSLERQPEPEDLTVTITGNTATKTYNGSEQSVTGYTISIPEGATLTASEIVGPTQASAIARGTVANGGSNPDGSYPMGLTADDFSTENSDYNVTFDVVDGWLKIVPAELYDITGDWYDDCYSITFNSDGTYYEVDQGAGYENSGTYEQTEDEIIFDGATNETYFISEGGEGTEDDELIYGIHTLNREGGTCDADYCMSSDGSPTYYYGEVLGKQYRVSDTCSDFVEITTKDDTNGLEYVTDIIHHVPLGEFTCDDVGDACMAFASDGSYASYLGVTLPRVEDMFAEVIINEYTTYLVTSEDTVADFGIDLYYDAEMNEPVDPATQFEPGMTYSFFSSDD